MQKPIVIAVTGPESTGKSALSAQLAAHYQTIFVEEQSRVYLNGLDRHWKYEDVLTIARLQLKQMKEGLKSGRPLVVFDTEMIAIKVWLEFYKLEVPEWITRAIVQAPITHYLLMDIDLPWVPDKLRENLDDRAVLFGSFERHLQQHQLPYTIINGEGEARLAKAIALVDGLTAGSAKTIPAKTGSRDPLHGVTLEMMLQHLVAHFGWAAMGERINIRCFNHDPSIKSSLTFLRKTPWARTQVEQLYLESLK